MRPQLGTAMHTPAHTSQRTVEVVGGAFGSIGFGALPDWEQTHPGVPSMHSWQEIWHSNPNPVPPQSAFPLHPFATPPSRTHLPWVIPGVHGGHVTPTGQGGQSVLGASSQCEPGSQFSLAVQSDAGVPMAWQTHGALHGPVPRHTRTSSIAQVGYVQPQVSAAGGAAGSSVAVSVPSRVPVVIGPASGTDEGALPLPNAPPLAHGHW